jgi:hypothetical protein
MKNAHMIINLDQLVMIVIFSASNSDSDAKTSDPELE